MTIRYLFCITPGRSGSDYQAGLLAHARNAVAVHEGVPVMNGRPMRRFNDGDDRELCALLPAKLRAIRRRAKPGHVYCETNHSFVKGWGYLLPDAFVPQDRLGVVVLRRDPDAVAYSLLRLHDLPGRTEWGRTWYLTPGAARDRTPPPDRPTPLDLCRWYVREVGRRADDYRRRFPGVTYFDCDLDELNRPAGVRPGPGGRPTAQRAGRVAAAAAGGADRPARVPVRRPPARRGARPADRRDGGPPAASPGAGGGRDAPRRPAGRRFRHLLPSAEVVEVEGMRPDDRLAGTRLLAVTRVVAEAEPELERRSAGRWRSPTPSGPWPTSCCGRGLRGTRPSWCTGGRRRRASRTRSSTTSNRRRGEWSANWGCGARCGWGGWRLGGDWPRTRPTGTGVENGTG